MDPALANLGWTEDQWSRICNVVAEETQRARVCAQALPVIGLDDPTTTAIPQYSLTSPPDPFPATTAPDRLEVNSDPTLYITTISVNVPVRSQELADPELRAALTMFRRAANYVGRLEDTLFLQGRAAGAPFPVPPGIPPVFQISSTGSQPGIFTIGGRLITTPLPPVAPPPPAPPPPPPVADGNDVFNRIVEAINRLEANGQSGPFACLLSHSLFALVCTPTAALVLPRDRILPFLQGPLLRSSQVPANEGCVIALGGSPLEIVVASDISVRYLQTTPEPRYMFRVSERVALRIKEPEAIAILR